MRTLIIDDEGLTRVRLRRLLSAYPEVQIEAEAENGLQAIELLKNVQPDLVFLDIHMPELDGFEVLRNSRSGDKKPLIVFVTGYDQYALKAFQVNALCYLLKPIVKDQLDLAVKRASLLCASPSLEQHKAKDESINKIVGRRHDEIALLNTDDILWFASLDGTVMARNRSEAYEVNHQLTWLEHFAGRSFFRARRTLLVNLDHVTAIRALERSTFMLVMDDARKTEWLVSERQAKALRQRLPGL